MKKIFFVLALLLSVASASYSQQLSKLEPYIAANDSSWVPISIEIGNGTSVTRKAYGRDLFRNVLDSLVNALMGKSDTGTAVFDTTTIYKVLASKADTGVIDDARLSGNVALKNALNTFLSQNVFQTADDTYTIRVGYDGSNYSDFRTYAGGTLLISSIGSNPSVRLGVGGNPILQASNTQVSVARLFRPSTTTPLDLGTDVYRWGNLFLNNSIYAPNTSASSTPTDSAFVINRSTGEGEVRPISAGSSFDTTGQLNDYQDAINARVKISDTADMLDDYQMAINTKANLIGTIQTSQLTTQRSRNSTSWGDITGLSFPILANKAYWFKFHIQYAGAAETTGAKFGITGPPTGVTTVHRSIVTDWDGSNWTDYKSPVLVSYDAGTNSFTAGSHLQPRNIAIVEGTISVGEDGVIQARFASEVGGSNVTVQPWLSFVQFIQLN